MKLLRKVGATSQILQVFIQDSSSTTGAGLTGLTDASASLTAYYHRDTDTTATAISLVTMTIGTFTSSGFIEIDATNMPGWYQFCPPNAALASGAVSVGIHLKGAANMAPLPIEIDLDGQVDVTHWLGTAASTPNVAGVPNVNVKTWNDLTTVALPLVPTTAGRTLDVAATGEAGLDFNNVLSTSTVTLNALTVTGTFTISDGMLVNRSTSDSSAVVFTGNGTGDGLMCLSGTGATGDGAMFQSQATNGHGLNTLGNGTGNGILGTGVSGSGIKGTATTSGHGIQGIGVGSAKHGLQGTGSTNADGISGVGAGTGHGMQLTGGGTSGSGLKLVLGGTGKGLLVDQAQFTAAVAFDTTLTVTGALTVGTNAIPWNAAWDAEVQSECADALVAYDGLVPADLPTNFAALGINGSGHISRVTLTDTVTTYTGNTVQTGDSFARLGAPAGASVSADIAIIDGIVDAIVLDTNELQTDWANGGRLDLILDARSSQTSMDDLPTNAELATALGTADDATLAAIAALNNLSAAQVNAEVVDALNVDTYAEIGQEAPAATTTLRKMIAYLYKTFRNKKTQTATQFSLFADDGTTVDQKATVSDDGSITTIGELTAGP